MHVHTPGSQLLQHGAPDLWVCVITPLLRAPATGECAEASGGAVTQTQLPMLADTKQCGKVVAVWDNAVVGLEYSSSHDRL